MNKYLNLAFVLTWVVVSACTTPKPVLVANLGEDAKGQSMTTDYRWIMSLQHSEDSTARNIVCTEPSPDEGSFP